MPEMTFGQMREAAASQGFEPHPIGEYLFKVESAEVKPGKVSNQIMIRMVNQNGPHANKSVLNRLAPYKNNGEVNGMFFQQVKALGFADQDPIWSQLDQLGLDQGLAILAQQMPGRYTVATITHDDWGGETRDNVKRMKPYSAAPGMPSVGGAVPGPALAPQPSPPAVVQPLPPAAPPTPPMVPMPVPVPTNTGGTAVPPNTWQQTPTSPDPAYGPVSDGYVVEESVGYGDPALQPQPQQGFVGNGGGTPPGGVPANAPTGFGGATPPEGQPVQTYTVPPPMEAVTVPQMPVPQPPVAPVVALPQPNVPTPPENPF